MRILCTIIAVALLFAACGTTPPTTNVSTDYDPGVDFSAYKSYAWATPIGDATQSALDTQVKKVVAAQLVTKGFTEAASMADADMIVSALTSEKHKTEIQDDGWGWGDDFGGPESQPYDDGTVAVTLGDPKTKTVLWKGTAKMEVESKNFSINDVEDAVQRMFADFPPKKK